MTTPLRYRSPWYVFLFSYPLNLAIPRIRFNSVYEIFLSLSFCRLHSLFFMLFDNHLLLGVLHGYKSRILLFGPCLSFACVRDLICWARCCICYVLAACISDFCFCSKATLSYCGFPFVVLDSIIRPSSLSGDYSDGASLVSLLGHVSSLLASSPRFPSISLSPVLVSVLLLRPVLIHVGSGGQAHVHAFTFFMSVKMSPREQATLRTAAKKEFCRRPPDRLLRAWMIRIPLPDPFNQHAGVMLPNFPERKRSYWMSPKTHGDYVNVAAMLGGSDSVIPMHCLIPQDKFRGRICSTDVLGSYFSACFKVSR